MPCYQLYQSELRIIQQRIEWVFRVRPRFFQAAALLIGFEDAAVIGETFDQGTRFPRGAENTGPFPKREIDRHDNANELMDLTDEALSGLAAFPDAGKTGEFGENDEVRED